ncbi:hypothetical protein Tco_0233627 [Tanacetum coccineum]
MSTLQVILDLDVYGLNFDDGPSKFGWNKYLHQMALFGRGCDIGCDICLDLLGKWILGFDGLDLEMPRLREVNRIVFKVESFTDALFYHNLLAGGVKLIVYMFNHLHAPLEGKCFITTADLYYYC